MNRSDEPTNLHDTLVDDHVAIARRFSSRPLGQCCVFSEEESVGMRQDMPTLRIEDVLRSPRPAPLRSPELPSARVAPLPPPDMPLERRNPVILLPPEQVSEIFAEVRRRTFWRRARAVFALVLTCSAIGAVASFALRVMHST